MGRQPCCDKLGVKRGPWTAEEDRKLISFILSNGHCCWRAVPKLAGLLRCGKSCRLRWTNYLRPDLKRGLLTDAEELVVIDLHAKLGNRCLHYFASIHASTTRYAYACMHSSLDRCIHIHLRRTTFSRSGRAVQKMFGCAPYDFGNHGRCEKHVLYLSRWYFTSLCHVYTHINYN